MMSLVCTVAALLLATAAENRLHRPARFLVLDLEGDGIYLSDVYYPVRFDVDGDGTAETMTWTASGSSDGFLWLDANGNGVVDDGMELLLTDPRVEAGVPPGATTFDRLVALDSAEGGPDGALWPTEPLWRRLGVWVDRDQNARSAPEELSSLDDWAVKKLDLRYWTLDTVDGTLNRVVAESTFDRSSTDSAGETVVHTRRILEIEFRRCETRH